MSVLKLGFQFESVKETWNYGMNLKAVLVEAIKVHLTKLKLLKTWEKLKEKKTAFSFCIHT